MEETAARLVVVLAVVRKVLDSRVAGRVPFPWHDGEAHGDMDQEVGSNLERTGSAGRKVTLKGLPDSKDCKGRDAGMVRAATAAEVASLAEDNADAVNVDTLAAVEESGVRMSSRGLEALDPEGHSPLRRNPRFLSIPMLADAENYDGCCVGVADALRGEIDGLDLMSGVAQARAQEAVAAALGPPFRGCPSFPPPPLRKSLLILG